MPTKPKTVRVRIAVAVDAEGEWNSFGFSEMGEDAMSHAAEHVGDDPAKYWIEVDLPAPEEIVVTDVVVTQET